MSPQKIHFVSDLHIFCRRFDGERFWNLTAEVAGEATAVVLGGDIFDFRWTTMATIERTADAAIARLTSMLRSHPECTFHYLVGNHDHHEAFLTRLARLAEDEPNLTWQPYHLRLGSNAFVHGDVAGSIMGLEGLKRKRRRWLRARRQGRIANWLYDVIVDVRLHKLAYRVVYPNRVVARRILAYLDRIGHGPDTGVADVYFGHTHLALSGFEYKGVRFHNCGAPIKGCRFHILEGVVSES